jgi:DNA-binding FadR family transcriptional regulator
VWDPIVWGSLPCEAVSVSRTPELPSERTERLVRAHVAGLASGDQLPPLKTWATELGTSRTTLGRVLGKLRAEGLIVVRSGWGTFKA